ncbi:hypothetical protein BE17_51105 [Sorangium cellulosum]|uniref:Uncharacterized protein n=1 Tax=Sorangium cellulosum TaxID=56 RepID=A0A150R7A3_SORCE|nr:hypothetical protein BE17_51105 [Sorangium cellulosum]
MKPSHPSTATAACSQPLQPGLWEDPDIGPVLRRLAVQDPDLIEAVADVDRSLIRLALAQAPLDRLRSSSNMMRTLMRFRREPTSEGR